MFFCLLTVRRASVSSVNNLHPSGRTTLVMAALALLGLAAVTVRAEEAPATTNAPPVLTAEQRKAEIATVVAEIQANAAARGQVIHDLEFGDAGIGTLRKQVHQLESELVAKRKLLNDMLLAHAEYKASEEKRIALFRRWEELKQQEGAISRPLAKEAAGAAP